MLNRTNGIIKELYSKLEFLLVPSRTLLEAAERPHSMLKGVV